METRLKSGLVILYRLYLIRLLRDFVRTYTDGFKIASYLLAWCLLSRVSWTLFLAIVLLGLCGLFVQLSTCWIFERS